MARELRGVYLWGMFPDPSSGEIMNSSQGSRSNPRIKSRRELRVALAWLCMASGAVLGAEPARFELRSPLPYQVVQRQGFEPGSAHEHNVGGPALGFALVPVELDLTELQGGIDGSAVFEYRVVKLENAFGAATDWAQADGRREAGTWSGTVKVPAGGWYRLEVRARRDEQVLAAAGVEPMGVGEVFVIAGQSYAVGANDELTKVLDPQGRVAAYDVVNKKWQVANDPQPNAGEGGTIWPTMGDHLLPLARVPIGFVNVAVGGTATRQWLPGEKLYEALAAAGKTVGRFCAVLWQQGESDVIEHRSTDYYVQNMVTIRTSLAKAWGFEPVWLLAKSTLHPTVYNDPEGEGTHPRGDRSLVYDARFPAWTGHGHSGRRESRWAQDPAALLRHRPAAGGADVVCRGVARVESRTRLDALSVSIRALQGGLDAHGAHRELVEHQWS